MPVVKVYDMSTVEEVKSTYQAAQEMQELKKYDEYSKDNIMLVRTTEIFPEGRVIKPLADASYVAKNGSNFIYQAMYYEMDYAELKKLESCEMAYRSTVHFTENGLVSSHMYGNFDNQEFIIMDPLSEHAGVSDVRNFAGQDTFIKGNVTLSDKAIIIVKAENYEAIKQAHPEIENFNVVLYNGISPEVKDAYIKEHEGSMPEFDVNDQRAVVEKALIDLGYAPELIGSHYIINSPTSDKISEVNKDLASEYDVLANSKHNYSEEYEDDFKKNMLITEIFNKLLLDFIIKIHNIDSSVINVNDKIDNNTAHNLIGLLGIDVVADDIDAFNKTVEKMQELGMLPTSGELISNNIPDIYSAYVQLQTLEEGQKLN